MQLSDVIGEGDAGGGDVEDVTAVFHQGLQEVDDVEADDEGQRAPP
jgi:hypothetical protein